MRLSLRAFVERVIASGLLNSALVELADRGATAAEFALVPTLPEELRDLLAWRNGLDLDVIRLHGVGAPAGRRVERTQVAGLGDAIVFASDPAGFLYLLRTDGAVNSFNHEGGKFETVADDVGQFLRGYVFGARAGEFGGEKWAQDVAAALGEG